MKTKKNIIIIISLLLILVSSAQAFSGNNIEERAKDAVDQLYNSINGQEFKQVLTKIESNVALKQTVLTEITESINENSAVKLIPKGKINLVFVDQKGYEIDSFFKIENDMTFSDLNTKNSPTKDITVYFDESLMQKIRNSNNEKTTIMNAIDKNNIRFKSKTFSNKLKIVIIKFMSKIYLLFQK